MLVERLSRIPSKRMNPSLFEEDFFAVLFAGFAFFCTDFFAGIRFFAISMIPLKLANSL